MRNDLFLQYRGPRDLTTVLWTRGSLSEMLSVFGCSADDFCMVMIASERKQAHMNAMRCDAMPDTKGKSAEQANNATGA